MFRITFDLKEIEKDYKTFEEAFTDFYYLIKESLKEGTCWQVLETMHWIENIHTHSVMLFYEARDHAAKLGILTEDGQLRIKK